MRSVIKQLSLTVLFLITVMLVLPAPAQAQPPVDLQLNGEGAAPWDISNLQPGDTGTKMLTLRNAGSRPGFITIWLSSIVNSEGDNPEQRLVTRMNRASWVMFYSSLCIPAD